MSDEPRAPGLEHVGNLLVDIALSKARTMLPGRVVSYDADAGSVVVELLIMETHLDETEDDVSETVSQLGDVPVAFYGGNANRVTVPVKAGDYGRVVFASRDIAKWKLTGGVVDPDDPRVHDINDCVFEPGLHVLGQMPTTAPDDAIVTHGATKVGGPDGTEKTAMMETFLNELSILNTSMMTLWAAQQAVNAALAAFPLTTTPLAVVGPAVATAASNYVTAMANFVSLMPTFKTQLAEVK